MQNSITLCYAFSELVGHFNHERNSQGDHNAILFPEAADRIDAVSGQITSKESIGALPRFYHRESE